MTLFKHVTYFLYYSITGQYVLGCDDMLKKLEKERELLFSRKTFSFENDTFGAGQTEEIIEPYEEEEEKKWRGKFSIL